MVFRDQFLTVKLLWGRSLLAVKAEQALVCTLARVLPLAWLHWHGVGSSSDVLSSSEGNCSLYIFGRRLILFTILPRLFVLVLCKILPCWFILILCTIWFVATFLLGSGGSMDNGIVQYPFDQGTLLPDVMRLA